MQSFQFPLDRVLLWYREQERLEKSRLVACILALSQAQEAISRLREERLTIRRSVISSGISTQELATLGPYVHRTIERESELASDVRQRELALQEQKLRVQAARSKVQLLEHLRERRADEHNYAAERELEAVAADSYMSKWSQQ